MAYVEIKKSGRLVSRRVLDDERARKGCSIGLKSGEKIKLVLGQSAVIGEYEIAVVAQASGTEEPVSASRPAMSQEGYPIIEGYQITGRLGEGGMGTVWKAMQLSTHREVALKLMGSGSFGSEKAKARFEREVELSARLEHPNVARIYDSGLYHGIYYYAMELVDGAPLDTFVRDKNLNLKGILELMEQVCRGVQHAHQRGVIHRDLKPSNILVSPDGRPHVVDFGLAKAFQETDEDLLISIEGEVAGTPAYMAPEQATGQMDKIDTRTDVYGLGIILYRLVTNEWPRDMSGNRYDVLTRIAESEIRRPRQVKPDLDRELEAILLKALEADPDHRYRTAGDLADDIENCLAGEPISAQPATATYILKKKLRKYRLQTAIAASILFLIGVVGVLASYKVGEARAKASEAAEKARQQAELAQWSQSEATRQANRAKWAQVEAELWGQKAGKAQAVLKDLQRDSEFTKAEAARNIREAQHAQSSLVVVKSEAERLRKDWLQEQGRAQKTEKQLTETLETSQWNRYIRGLALAERAFHEGKSRLGIDLLKGCPEEYRSWEWDYLKVMLDRSTHTFLTPVGKGGAIGGGIGMFSPDGRRIIGVYTGGVVTWDAQTKKELTRVNLPGFFWLNRGFDGKHIACCLQNPDKSKETIEVYDLQNGRKIMTVKQPVDRPEGFLQALVGAGGTTLATLGRGGTVRFFDMKTKQERPLFQNRFGPATGIMLSPNEKRVVLSFEGGILRIWDIPSGKLVQTIYLHTEDSWPSLFFNSNGTRLFTGTTNGFVRLWDVATGKEVWAASEHERGCGGCPSLDGKWVATTGFDNVIFIRDASNGKAMTSPSIHPGIMTGIDFSPDGRWVLSSSDCELKLWDVSRLLHSCYQDIQVYDNGYGVRFSPSTMRMISFGAKAGHGFIKVADLRSGQELLVVPITQMYPQKIWVAISPDGTKLAHGWGLWGEHYPDPEKHPLPGRPLEVWSIPEKRRLFSFPCSYSIYWGLRFTPDSRQLACGATDLKTHVWDLGMGKEKVTIDGFPGAYDHQGLRLVSVFPDKNPQIRDANSGKLLCSLKGKSVCSAAFSPDGKWVAMGNWSGSIGIFDSATGAMKFQNEGHSVPVRQLTFTTDGKRLLSGGDDCMVRIWDIDHGDLLMTLPQDHEYRIYSLDFTPDGRTLVSIDERGIIVRREVNSH